jgi:Zn-dependent protease with chaperone function
MKTIFAIMLLVLSSLAQAADPLVDSIYPRMSEFRAALVKEALPHRRSLVVEELVDTMAMHDVDVIVSAHPVQGGAHYFPGVIIVGSTMASLPREQLAFVLAHEYGHHVRGHWRSTLSRGLGLASAAGKPASTIEELAPFTIQAVTPETSHHDELDADRAAIVLLKSFGLYDEKAITTMLTTFGDDASSTHPSALARIKAITAVE